MQHPRLVLFPPIFRFSSSCCRVFARYLASNPHSFSPPGPQDPVLALHVVGPITAPSLSPGPQDPVLALQAVGLSLTAAHAASAESGGGVGIRCRSLAASAARLLARLAERPEDQSPWSEAEAGRAGPLFALGAWRMAQVGGEGVWVRRRGGTCGSAVRLGSLANGPGRGVGEGGLGRTLACSVVY